MRKAGLFKAIGLGAILILSAPGVARNPVAAENESDLRRFLQGEFADARRSAPTTRYSVAWTDLNGDRRPEAVVYIFDHGHGYWCGSGGCNLVVFEGERRSWRTVGSTSITRPPVRLLNSRTNGWRDLSVYVAGGGIIPGYHALLPFDGRSYASNPSMPPARELRRPASGRVLISRQNRGRLLF